MCRQGSMGQRGGLGVRHGHLRMDQVGRGGKGGGDAALGYQRQ